MKPNKYYKLLHDSSHEGFNQQKSEFNTVIAFTFRPDAWDLVKKRLPEGSRNKSITELDFYGKPCYICNKQKQELIGWHNQLALDMWLDVDGDVSRIEGLIFRKLLSL